MRWRHIAGLCLLLALCACGDDLHDPLIEAILPDSASPGVMVDVVGERFDGVTRQVSFGATPAQAVLWQDRRVRVQVPAGISGLTRVVVTVDGMPSNPVSFQVQ